MAATAESDLEGGLEVFLAELDTRLAELTGWMEARLQGLGLGAEAEAQRQRLGGRLAVLLASHALAGSSAPPTKPQGPDPAEGKAGPSAAAQRKPTGAPLPAVAEHDSSLALPPGHFVSQLVGSPLLQHNIRRTTSLPVHDHPQHDGDEGGAEREQVRVSLEGVAQLGQLLCRMMLFPIFRSNNEYLHWKKIFRTIVRIRLPDDCRRKVWTIVARRTIPPAACTNLLQRVEDADIMDLCVQIEKDLHRTSDDAFFRTTVGRGMLARVLLAYSQHNKAVGYCQSLNFIVAHLLLLMNKNEDDAFAALAVLVDQLPQNYFTDLECLAVDMVVFDELMKERLPRLHGHMRRLLAQDVQRHGAASQDDPPLTNMFIGQWFPTLYATLLPQGVLYRVWDSLLFDGDEMLFRVGLAIFTLLEDRLLHTHDTLHFYSEMKTLTEDLAGAISCDEMLKLAYNLYPFPLPRLAELRVIFTKRRAELVRQERARNSKAPAQGEDKAFMSFFKFGSAKRSDQEGAALPAATKARQQEALRADATRQEALARRMAEELASKRIDDSQ